ncbi:hypothetical protein JTB14_002562 [Gonioctena quinquepunctata]|nr:hypothetical protein JTB14_002562 [Gonioctena quinquepunctata]
MKLTVLIFVLLNSAKYLHGEVAVIEKKVSVEKEEAAAVVVTNENTSQIQSKEAPQPIENGNEVKVMIRNINSGLVLDGSDFVVEMAPLLGTYTQLWTFERSNVNPDSIIFTNVANRRVLTTWPYSRLLFCYDFSDNLFTKWSLNEDRRLVSAAYPGDFVTYGYGQMAVSLRPSTASDGTDEWILVESKENQ